jgi:site-specific DNA-methyltransferase (adenine-specific)
MKTEPSDNPQVELKLRDVRGVGDRWGTDTEIFEDMNREFQFTVDAAADKTNARISKFFTKKDNGLAQDWTGERVWCNPPYSDLYPWVAKAAERKAAVAVLLLPARVDRAWWHNYVWDNEGNCPRPGVEIRYAKGRVRFFGTTTSPAWCTVAVIWHGA